MRRIGKRGDVPTILLVPITLILIIAALFYFRSYNGEIQNKSSEVAEIIEEVTLSQATLEKVSELIGEEALASESDDMKKKFQEIAAGHDLRWNGVGNFFAKIRTGDFVFEKKEKSYILEIKGLFVQSERGANKMKRGFDIIKKFKERDG
ncbi:hypothetical protein FJZ18_02755 [Candidatus Pacearchaeota archaeon]|nr:hypothetical protein [Candidatus Pacearchaeota archaeon]